MERWLFSLSSCWYEDIVQLTSLPCIHFLCNWIGIWHWSLICKPFFHHFISVQASECYSVMKWLQHTTSQSFLFLPLLPHQPLIIFKNDIKNGIAIYKITCSPHVRCVLISTKPCLSNLFILFRWLVDLVSSRSTAGLTTRDACDPRHPVKH